MSILAKIGIPAIVIIGLIGGTWFMKHDGGNAPTNGSSLAGNSKTTGQLKKNDQPTSQTSSQTAAISSRDSSNTSLDADMTAIEGQIKTMDSSNAAVDQTDKPVSQDSL